MNVTHLTNTVIQREQDLLVVATLGQFMLVPAQCHNWQYNKTDIV